jgi:hypothetical protein
MRSFISRLFGDKGKGSSGDFKPASQQDPKSKTVTQLIEGESTTFSYADFEDQKGNTGYDRFFAGQLALPTGMVVCTDPMLQELAFPQNWVVKSGNYDVYLYISLDEEFEGRVAYAELVLKDEVPVFWEFSLIAEEHLNNPLEKKINGFYPVDAGLSCFADHETFIIYQQEVRDFYSSGADGNFYTDILEQYFKVNAGIPASSRGDDWANYKPVKAMGNIILFGTGWGDGLYPRYVGLDAKGHPVKLITDFT